jgi:phosphoribosylformylglycinamidine synthase
VFLARHDSLRGFVLSEGIHPYLSDLDPRAMAMTAVDEAVRRQLCAGAALDRIAALDNFCWPDPIASPQTPDGEYKLAQLVLACRGLAEACLAYGVPLISGKDSMKNEAIVGGVKICAPPTLLVSALGQIDDVRRALTLELRAAGDALYALGETGDHTGASEYFRYLGEREGLRAEIGRPAPYVGRRPPTVDPERNLELYRALERATREGLVRSATTPTRGGLAVALARSALAGGLGAELDLDRLPATGRLPADVLLFSESTGRFLVTVAPADREGFESCFRGLACERVGEVSEEPRLRWTRSGAPVGEVTLRALREGFQRRNDGA